MRLIWLPIVALACVGTVFLFRGSLRAHAEKYSDAIEKVQSNKEAKGDRLDLLYRPSKRQPPAPVEPLLAPQEPAAVQAIPARQTTAKPESSKSAETVTWHWREGAKTITKTSSSGEKTQLSRTKVR
jgi:cytoskeletal protein RodZ